MAELTLDDLGLAPRKIQETVFELTKGQREAERGIIEAFSERVGIGRKAKPQTVVLKGAAGTGKTFLLKQIIPRLYREPQLSALTHKAAAIMSKQTGREVVTLAKVLKQSKYDDLDTGESHFKSAGNIALDGGKTILFIDEASMMNKENFETVRDKIMPHYHVLLIGDKFQLPPVNEDESLAFCSGYNEFELTEPCRFGEGSGIDKTAISIRTALETGKQMQGMKEILEQHDDVVWIGANKAAKLMVESFRNATDADSARVIAFTNAQVHMFNRHVKRTLQRDSATYSVGDMVMANASYDPDESLTDIFTSVANNESLLLTRVDDDILKLEDRRQDVECWRLTTECGREILVAKDQKFVEARMADLRSAALKYPKGSDGRRTFFRQMFGYQNNIGDIRLNFAQTVHKSQGSTYATCFFDLNRLDKDSPLGKQLLYTGVTRAAKKLVLFR